MKDDTWYDAMEELLDMLQDCYSETAAYEWAGSELYRGLGAIVLGGLTASTIFTLVLVPALFSLTMDAKETLLGLLRGETEEQIEVTPAEKREPVAVS